MAETIARIRIELAYVEPAIWRRVDVPVDINLKMLHDIIQAAMGWMDCHLWHFDDGNLFYGILDPDWPDDNKRSAKATKLATLIDRGIRKLDYTYDMGDDWLHHLDFEEIGPGKADARYPIFIDGACPAPPEDIGGAPGFEQFLEIISDPRHPEHKELTQWHRESFGCDYDPDTFDAQQAKWWVAQIAKRRTAGKRSAATRKPA